MAPRRLLRIGRLVHCDYLATWRDSAMRAFSQSSISCSTNPIARGPKLTDRGNEPAAMYLSDARAR